MIAARLGELLKTGDDSSNNYGWPESKMYSSPQVHAFLAKNVDLQPMAMQACELLRKTFPGALLEVDTLMDPETSEDMLVFDVHAVGLGKELRAQLSKALVSFDYPAAFIFSVFPAK